MTRACEAFGKIDMVSGKFGYYPSQQIKFLGIFYQILILRRFVEHRSNDRTLRPNMTMVITMVRPVKQAQDTQLKRADKNDKNKLLGADETHPALAEVKLQIEVDKLRHTNRLLEQVKQLSGVGGWELTLDPPSLSWTEETKRIHEVPLDYEPDLQTAIEFYAVEARPIITGAVENAMIDGTGWDLELPLITAKGRRIWVRAVGSPTYQDDRVVGAIGAFQDITERRQQEESIRLSEQEAKTHSKALSDILENMSEGVSVFDEHGRAVVWNQKYIELFEKAPSEVFEGVSFQKLLECEKSRGDFCGEVGEHIRQLKAELFEKGVAIRQFQMKNGKVIKSLHSSLPRGGWVGTHTDVTTEFEVAKRDAYGSRHDPLTGLPNRLEFATRLNQCAKNEEESQRTVLLLLVDLDYFKTVNDKHGHQVGDELLVAAAQRMQSSVRAGDLVSRLGGDEFAIIAVCNKGDESRVAGTIALEITTQLSRPFDIEGIRLEIGASVGIAAMPSHALNADDIMSRADYALYKVKERGRGGFQSYNSNLHNEACRKNKAHAAVKSAVLDNSLKLSFQPFYDLRALSVAGAEALLRWKNSMEGLRPTELIQIAEETGAITEIGDWVLENSIRAASEWCPNVNVAVNVSPIQLGTNQLLKRIVRLSREHGFAANRLELEITEGTLLHESASVLDELNKIRALGSKIVLDDFGTGFASLGYLQRFPFDKIKVDRSFVSDTIDDRKSRAFVRSIVTLASQLGIESTAEGIESYRRLDQVTEAGCTFGQGFHLSKPIPNGEFTSSMMMCRKTASFN